MSQAKNNKSETSASGRKIKPSKVSEPASVVRSIKFYNGIDKDNGIEVFKIPGEPRTLEFETALRDIFVLGYSHPIIVRFEKDVETIPQILKRIGKVFVERGTFDDDLDVIGYHILSVAAVIAKSKDKIEEKSPISIFKLLDYARSYLEKNESAEVSNYNAITLSHIEQKFQSIINEDVEIS